MSFRFVHRASLTDLQPYGRDCRQKPIGVRNNYHCTSRITYITRLPLTLDKILNTLKGTNRKFSRRIFHIQLNMSEHAIRELPSTFLVFDGLEPMILQI